jgi:hypothetical protein
MGQGIIQLVPAGIQRSVSSEVQQALVDKLLQNVTSRTMIKGAGIGLKKKQSIASAIANATPEQLLSLAKASKTTLTFTDETMPSYLRALGYRAIPELDYLSGEASLRQLYKSPDTAEAARDAFRHNLRTTYSLYTNPSSPVFRRIVGNETDPVKIEKLINAEKKRLAAFYRDYNKSLRMAADPEVYDLERLVGMNGPLSRTTKPQSEQVTAVRMLENTGDQYRTSNFPEEELLQTLGTRGGTHYGAPSIDDANRVLLSEQSWIDDPTLLNSAGRFIKAPSYVRNILRPGRGKNARWLYPGMSEPSLVATADSNFVYTGLGMKPFGPQPGNRALTEDQDLYNMLIEDATEVGKEFGYLVPSDFQAVIWAPGRELFEGMAGDVRFLNRPLNMTQEAADMLRLNNPDPRGYRDRMREAAEKAYNEELASKGPSANLTEKRRRQLEKFDRIDRSNPKLMALAALLAGGGAAGYEAMNQDSQAQAGALDRMRGFQ